MPDLAVAAIPSPRPRKPRRGTRKLCFIPDCPGKGRHRHHITYEPAVVKRICVEHHRAITAVNINRTEMTHRKLTNEERWSLWHAWLAGEVQPIYTANVQRWLGSW